MDWKRTSLVVWRFDENMLVIFEELVRKNYMELYEQKGFCFPLQNEREWCIFILVSIINTGFINLYQYGNHVYILHNGFHIWN